MDKNKKITMKFKTLVSKKGSKLQEFCGYDSNFGWITSQAPIHMFNESLMLDELRKTFPEQDFKDIELVTIEVNILN